MGTNEIMKQKKYCVYYHKSPSGKVYVGQTCEKPEKRWGKEGKRYKTSVLFYKAICKYGWDSFEHCILATNLSQEDADKIEIWLISKYKSLGISYNIAEGGQCTLGETPMLGKKHTEEAKQKMSESAKGIHTGSKNGMAKAILQFSKSGEFIREWDCITDVERELNIKVTAICNNLKGYSKSSGGYVWKYKN